MTILEYSVNCKNDIYFFFFLNKALGENTWLKDFEHVAWSCLPAMNLDTSWWTV